MIGGYEFATWSAMIVIVRVEKVVPAAFVALTGATYDPVMVGVPVIAPAL